MFCSLGDMWAHQQELIKNLPDHGILYAQKDMHTWTVDLVFITGCPCVHKLLASSLWTLLIGWHGLPAVCRMFNGWLLPALGVWHTTQRHLCWYQLLPGLAGVAVFNIVWHVSIQYGTARIYARHVWWV
jgi:hypothetical protein